MGNRLGMPSPIGACVPSSDSQPLFGKEEDADVSTSTRCSSVCSELDSTDSFVSAEKLAYQHDPFEPMYVNVCRASLDYPASRSFSADDLFADVEVRSGPGRRVYAPTSCVASTHEAEAAAGICGPNSGRALVSASGATTAFGTDIRAGENSFANYSAASDRPVMRIADTVCVPDLSSPQQSDLGAETSTVIEKSTVSPSGSRVNVGDRAKQGRPSKLQRLRAKQLADSEFHMQLSSSAEREKVDTKLLLKIANDPMAAKYACSVLRALNREATERIANGEDPAVTAARF